MENLAAVSWHRDVCKGRPLFRRLSRIGAGAELAGGIGYHRKPGGAVRAASRE
jgi:hypothetical protein